MIQAGTISTGSAPTVAVAGAYWGQLDQRIAEHDLAWRGGEVAPDREATGDRTTVRRCLVAQKVAQPVCEVGSARIRDWQKMSEDENKVIIGLG